ncbi:beta-lactamase regulating signal transducer with metallopeptidase domain [Sphingobacterium allocomposti]|uniref:Beta-lactamase regulating signal transducer with metallopeptidase domain n=1 Tax=Sphingobacterium allocomposti TaxID=415956 RepID=A0A5S5CWE2_9SPHI|nr:M56 family metallopeptidase [Sphingobacterium composti Yoo et al. 2007 non Ten et al. 2007]TYP86669.1 beta-lactamase regulating signal transducer with metallopeptidase domain [Sphingobacterium composti Yoo et al. 2007 non Ten et al. 2007]
MNSLFQNITHALGWSILHSLWQGLLLYSLLCIVYLATPKLSAKYKYLLAFVGQMAIFLSFITTFIHYVDFAPAYSMAEPAAILSTGSYAQLSHGFLNKVEPLFPWFTSIYVVGLFVQLIIFTNCFSKLHYLRTRGLLEPPMTWQDPFLQICSQLRIDRDVQLFLSEKVSVPLTLGHVKPIILFPVAFANNLDIKQVESILIHELAHIKRNDYLLNLLKVTVETVLFFNPFVWLFSKHIEAEREHACDDIVVRWVPSPIAYAQALMSVELLRGDAAPLYAMAATRKKHHLLHRIQRITKMEKNYINVKQHLIAAALSSMGLIMVAWISPAKDNTTINIPSQPGTPSGLFVPPSPLAPVAAEDCDTPESAADTVTPSNNFIVFTEQRDTIEPPVILKDPAIAVDEKELQHMSDNIRIHHNSPEWKQHIAKIEANAKRIEDYYNSDEWKQHIAAIEANAKKVEAYYNSPEWKQHIAKIEDNAKRIEEYYNSPQWKEHIAKVEANAKRVEAYYNSPQWKEHIAKIEANARKVEDYYNSPEWKEKIAKIEDNARKIEAYYNSPEWKEHVAKIEANAKKVADYYNSPEWKEKMKKINDRQHRPDRGEVQNRRQNDVNGL